MRFAVLASVLLLNLAPSAAAQDGAYYRTESRIDVRTPIGAFSVHEGEVGFAELVRRPYAFRPGFLYEYQDRCRGQRCLVDVRSLRDGRFVTRIDAPRVPRWLIEVGREPADTGPPEEQPGEDELPGAPR